MQIQGRFSHALVLPALLAVGFFGQNGTASPLDTVPDLPLKLSSSTVPFGGKVAVSGYALSLAPGARIHVTVIASGRPVRRVATAAVSRSHHWAATFSANHSGRVAAVPASTPLAAASRTDKQLPALKVSSHVTASAALGGKAGVSAPITGRVAPAGRYRLVLEKHGRGGWSVVSRGSSRQDGSFALAMRISSAPSKVRVRSLGGRLLDGGTSRTIRVTDARPALASWYDLYGNGVACGGVLRRNTLGVAHRTLKCGTKVTISYRGRTITVPVIDRGPYIAGREFDLTGATARALGFEGVGTIWVAR